MTPLAAYVLSLIFSSFPPGRTGFSLELLPQCGDDPKEAKCAVAPVCPRDMSDCAAPELSSRGCCALPRFVTGLGWVRTEPRDVGAKRLEGVAQAIADTAEARAKDWPNGDARDFSRVLVSASGWSMGFRQDVQDGLTTGPAGELCLMDLRRDTLRSLDPSLRGLSNDALKKAVTGRGYPELRRCFDAGAEGLLRARGHAAWACKKSRQSLDYGMFAIYSTGRFCSTREPMGKDHLAGARVGTLAKFRNRKATVFPAWYSPPAIGDAS